MEIESDPGMLGHSNALINKMRIRIFEGGFLNKVII